MEENDMPFVIRVYTEEVLRKPRIAMLLASPEERQAIYDKEADEYFEDPDFSEYLEARPLYVEFCRLNLPEEARILEIGVGTGALGVLLARGGYHNVDGLDANAKMIELCKTRKVYKNRILATLGKGNTIPAENDAYDAVLAVSCICPGHIESDAFPEMIRVTKPGGIIMFLVKDMSQYKDVLKDSMFLDGRFEADVQSLCDSGAWKMVKEPYIVRKLLWEDKGTMYIMQKL